MKKTFILFLSIVLTALSYGQLITTNPIFFTQSSGQVEIIFDATKGNQRLKDYTGEVYAHTGVLTNQSENNTQWKHAPTWGDNSPKYKLTSIGDNKWKFIITPNIDAFYGTKPNEKVEKLAFVFRSADKKHEGKDVGNTDIFIDVYEAGLSIMFTNPTTDKVATKGSSENITIESPLNAKLELFINGNSVKSTASGKILTHKFTYNSAIDYQFIAKATIGGQIARDTVNICVPSPVTTATRPVGYQDGITYSEDGTKATLIMYAPNKSNVFVIGDFTDWTQKNAYQMKKDGDYWWLTIDNLTPQKLYRFQYLVDGTLRVADAYTELGLDPWNDKWINEHHEIYPNMPAYPEGKTTGLVATLQSKKPTYNWEVTNFKIDNPDNVVIYELLIRDFTKEKSIEAAMGKLDYLKELGITAIELMPIQEFGGNNSWGYNTNLFFAPDKAYGSPNMYKKFIDECHKRGIAVILDMVFNHADGLHPFAMLYWDSKNNRPASDNPWMNVTAPHGFSVFNDFDHSAEKTRTHFKRVLKYWLEEYKVDGYRMDLTKGFTQNSGTENSYDQSRINYLTEYYNAVKSTKPDAMFILEHLVGGNEEKVLAEKGMYLWRNMNNPYSQSAMSWRDNSSFTGMNSFPRKWVGYAESHDEERNFYKAKTYGNGSIKTDENVRLKRIPLNVAFTVLTPGPKMIWQFGELGYDYSIDYNGGRTGEKPSVWEWLNIPLRKDAYDKSAKAITLKKMFPKAFTEGNYSLNVSTSDWSNGRRIALTHNDFNMVMIGNFLPDGSGTAYPNFPKTGIWYELMNGEELNVTDKNMTIKLPAGEVKIYTDRKINIQNSIVETPTKTELSIYPNLVKDIIRIQTKESIQSATVYNLQGKEVSTFYNERCINVATLPYGMYVLKVKTDKKEQILKFIKK